MRSALRNAMNGDNNSDASALRILRTMIMLVQHW